MQFLKGVFSTTALGYKNNIQKNLLFLWKLLAFSDFTPLLTPYLFKEMWQVEGESTNIK